MQDDCLTPADDAATREALAAFASIVSRVQELRHPSATLDLKSTAHRTRGGRATHTRNTYKIKASLSDFIADVEIAARRTLTTFEFALFRWRYFVELHNPCDSHHLLNGIRRKLGAAFIERQIFPFAGYIAEIDVREVRA